MTDYTTVKFDSCFELAHHVDQLETNDTTRNYGKSSTRTGNPSFYGGWTMQEAIDCGLAGGAWQEGAEAMPRLHVAHETLSGAPILAPQMESSMVGFAPNVPAFLAGAPDSMYHLEDIDSGDKLLKVAVHVGRYHGVEQHQILNRGAAIMAVLDQLSIEGYHIELYAIWRNSDGDTGCSIETRVKASTEHWSPDSVAFALAHAAFQRRLCWRVAESIDVNECRQGNGRGVEITDSSYGNGQGARFDDYDLSFGYVTETVERHLNTPKSAVEYIKDSTIRQLNTRGQLAA